MKSIWFSESFYSCVHRVGTMLLFNTDPGAWNPAFHQIGQMMPRVSDDDPGPAPDAL